MKKNLSRRKFMKRVGAAGAVVGFPTIVPSSVFGANAPSNRITLGHIGVGGQGWDLFRNVSRTGQGQYLAACDVVKARRDRAAGMVGGVAYNDFRELLARDDIDAVVIATPDHWHVPMSMAAIRAGKDVYCEKPLGISVEQDKALRAAVHAYGTVFQYGTQQRSSSRHCGRACELVRNGYIGELKAIHVVVPNNATGGKTTPQPVPEGLDYDMWLGPAPVTPYTHDRVFGTGRWHVYDYALGNIAGWGAHPLDIAHWGYPHVPIAYEGTGRLPDEGLFDTTLDWNIRGHYASGVEFTLVGGEGSCDMTTFVGTEGKVAVSRYSFNAEPASLLKERIKPGEVHLLQGGNHYSNFLNAVKTRSAPVSDIDSAVQSDTISHLCDIVVRTGRKLKWDPVKETIIGDDVAARMLSRSMRAPWRL